MAQTTQRRTSKQTKTTPQPSLTQRAWVGLSAIILILSGLAGFGLTLATAALFDAPDRLGTNKATRYEVVDTNRAYYAQSAVGSDAAVAPLSAVFTPEVQYWATLIKAWAILYEVDPNLIATVIQIESCGDPMVSSSAGAQGLFQVMPFHFSDGEDMLDVQTNARRGMDYLKGGLEVSEGHVGLALAGYNGGHGVINRGWAAWMPETQRYYYWGARIYSEAVSGINTSPTLQEWLSAGGSGLCARASQSQQQIEQATMSALPSQ